MKIELKSVRFSEALSEETNAFTADVWVNGKKCGYAKNDGQGGCTNIRPYFEQRELFRKAENWAKQQPPKTLNFGERDYIVNSNMETIVDDLFTQWIGKKEQKDIERKCKKAIIYKFDGGYHKISWKGITLEDLLKHPQHRLMVINKVKQLKREGKEILNTNIPEN